ANATRPPTMVSRRDLAPPCFGAAESRASTAARTALPELHGASAARNCCSRSTGGSSNLFAQPLERAAQMTLHGVRRHGEHMRDVSWIQIFLVSQQQDRTSLRRELQDQTSQSCAHHGVMVIALEGRLGFRWQ